MREVESTAKSTAKRWTALLSGALLVVLLAGAANAATFSVATGGSNLTWQTGSSVLPILGNLPPASGGTPAARWRPQGYPTIMGTGSNPVSLTIPPGIISFAPSYPVQLPVPSLPSYVQFTTGLAAYAPAGGPATFKPGAKTSRPANFSWCPGASANPACTTVLSGAPQGSISGIIKYTAGAAGPQFGGTMSVLNSGIFSWYTVIATLPTLKIKLNNEGAGTATIAAGPGYSNYVSSTGGGAGDKVFNSPPFVPTYYGAYSIITDPGVPASTIPGASSIGWGMPFTTGTVYIKFPWYPSPFATITGMGQDNRTPAGVGNISMVAGGILTAPGGGITIGQIVTFTMNVPEPNEVQMLASGMGLIGLLALVRRRTSA
jgi:hypothetical protein